MSFRSHFRERTFCVRLTFAKVLVGGVEAVGTPRLPTRPHLRDRLPKYSPLNRMDFQIFEWKSACSRVLRIMSHSWRILLRWCQQMERGDRCTRNGSNPQSRMPCIPLKSPVLSVIPPKNWPQDLQAPSEFLLQMRMMWPHLGRESGEPYAHMFAKPYWTEGRRRIVKFCSSLSFLQANAWFHG